jgi:ribosome biogenesis GTPase
MNEMTIADFGFTKDLEAYSREKMLPELVPGRVTQEHRERYVVTTGTREYDAEITGKLRFSASSRIDFPAVGDWVAMMIYEPDLAIIHEILPRTSLLLRQAIASPGEKQIIASNVDTAFIVQAINNNFNINRLERYLTICNSASIEPVLVISKTDLSTREEIDAALSALKARHEGIRYVLLDNISGKGLEDITGLLQKAKTYCVIGSSGVGKSTLINNLLKKNVLKTGEISSSTNKGRHVSEHRELFILADSGAIIIDTPGMKELGITDDSEGIKTTFNEIYELTLRCKLPHCTHTSEKGCAVIEGLDKGIIDSHSLENFRRMQREQQRFTTTEAERRKKDKAFGKMAKNIMAEKRKTKF